MPETTRTAALIAQSTESPRLVQAASNRSLGYVVKRLVDYIGAGFGLVLLSPLLLALAILVRIDSPGPALFRQERVGRDGEPFVFYKLRTMYVDNSSASHRRYVTRLILEGSTDLRGASGSFKIENDPRVTRIGRLLRKTSMDELPQLLNVVKGELSLVGPRPPVGYEADLYSREQRRRLEVLPGITGLWQVSGRCERSFEEMVELDVAYIDDWSIWMDMRILARTVPVVLSRKGAS